MSKYMVKEYVTQHMIYYYNVEAESVEEARRRVWSGDVIPYANAEADRTTDEIEVKSAELKVKLL